jgi:cytochrome c oxidase subunit IV
MAQHQDHLRVYLSVFGALMGLTFLTVYVAFADLGPLATPIALGIAGTKASLVILFFMHVKYETRLIGLYAASGFAMLLVMFAITMGEFAGRPRPGADPLPPPASAAEH